MEMRCEIKIYEYDVKTGKYNSFTAAILHKDINTSAKEIFDEVIQYKDNTSNKFFVMEIETTMKEPFSNSVDFYTIKTNEKSDVEEINIIGPNNMDQNMLIDAIIGCKPTVTFFMKCNDRIINKIIVRPLSKFYPDTYDEDNFSWTSDAKERLNKVNVIRLKEIYEKLRANQ